MIRKMQFLADIITIKCDVQFPVLNLSGWNQQLQLLYQVVRYKNSPGLKAYQDSISKVNVVFKNLVAKPFDRDRQLLFI